MHCDALREIRIPDGVKGIGKSTFQWCKSLEKVIFGKSIVSIDTGAFQYCEKLTEIDLPGTLKYISTNAFAYTGIHKVTIPNSVQSIGIDAFRDCKGMRTTGPEGSGADVEFRIVSDEWTLPLRCFPEIEEVHIPDGITRIGNDVFKECRNLSVLTLPDSVKEIGLGAFSNCERLESLHLPEGIKEIRMSMFSNCINLKAVNIPNSITVIGSHAFSGCSSLTSVTIPDSVEKVFPSAFDGCHSLTDIHVSEPSEFFSSGDGILFSKDRSELIAFPGGRKGAYVLPDHVTVIRANAFTSCHGLTEITIPESVREIGAWAFSFCLGLTRITIPDSVGKIGRFAFDYCANLAEVTISRNCSDYDKDVFEGCRNLKKAWFRGSFPEKHSGCIFDEDASLTAYYPGNDPSWAELNRKMIGGPGVTWKAWDPDTEQ